MHKSLHVSKSYCECYGWRDQSSHPNRVRIRVHFSKLLHKFRKTKREFADFMVASRTEQVSSNVHEFLVIICRISSIFRTLMSRIKITIFSGTPKILQLKFRRIVHLILEQNLLQKADHSIFHLVIALHSWPRVDRLSSFGSPIESLLPPSNSEG